ncbi:hypothetical protein M0804_000005 [Polistes exclamans]|nr:hypothetical protein M0804_000005 [Polistes exclamans]
MSRETLIRKAKKGCQKGTEEEVEKNEEEEEEEEVEERLLRHVSETYETFSDVAARVSDGGSGGGDGGGGGSDLGGEQATAAAADSFNVKFFISCSTSRVMSFLVKLPISDNFRMASKKIRKNHSIQHLLELPSSRETKQPSQFSSKQPTRSLPISTPRQVPITVLHPTPKKGYNLLLKSCEWSFSRRSALSIHRAGFGIGLTKSYPQSPLTTFPEKGYPFG